MKFKLVLCLSLFIGVEAISNEAGQNGEITESNYDARIERLYSCGHFFNVVGKQRKKQEEKDRYNSLFISSKNLADSLIKKHQKDLGGKHKKLVKKYSKLGAKKSIDMVKEIGNDKTGKKFGEITIDCYKNHQREDLVSTVGTLNDNSKP